MWEGFRYLCLTGNGTCDHVLKASFAELTASSNSLCVELGVRAMSFPLTGQFTEWKDVVLESRHSPPMKFYTTREKRCCDIICRDFSMVGL
jgi:hypothetical protein